MNLHIIARFHAAPGRVDALADALQRLAAPSRAEPGCLDFQILRGLRETDLFFIHSRWRDEAAFDAHAEEPHTRAFLTAVTALTDAPPEITRALRLG